jgi:hypothetical protein
MGFLANLFRGKPQAEKGYTTKDGAHGVWIYLQCNSCGEKIAVRLRTTSEIQKREGPDADLGPGVMFVQKTIVGSHCYQRIDAVVDFDVKYNVVGSQIKNGKLITAAEYEESDGH